ncbi:hypothetical protein KSP35_02705 [Aquihabitans sp. G128]|uniref:hypothetical protein n=1 Tax=Aquihabitans sp. G128 TaxID=2849779 RepID=UPI001C23B1EF|nr:hypothetical protein [Aquihabitans sp. G128]QXC61770.1 hypothetical protein KSP35_02705 [Aquihabitans sp. G128]
MAAGSGDDGTRLEEADDLYALDPAEFTAARNALAKRLRGEGRKAEATAVAARRRPSAAAGAINRVARAQPELVDDAIDAGTALRAATEAALAGDASGLRDATTAQRAAAEGLVRAALDLLGPAGPAARDRISAIVHAAAVDEAVADELRRGVVSADHDRSGLGLGLGGAAPMLALVPDPGTEPVRRERRTPRPAGRRRTGRPDGGQVADGAPAVPATQRAVESAAQPEVDAAEVPRSALDRRREQAGERKARQAAERERRRRLADLRAEAEHTATAADRLARQADDAEAAAADVRRRADAAQAAAGAAAEALRAAEAEAR